MLCTRNSGEGPIAATSPTEGGSRPEIFRKTRLQTVQSELFWSFNCEFFLKFKKKKKNFFWKPEQLAAMYD